MINKNVSLRSLRSIANKAFENAISQGMTKPNNYMYMFSYKSVDGRVKDVFKDIAKRRHQSWLRGFKDV